MNTHIIKLLFLAITITLMMTSCLKDDLNSPNVPQAGFTMINVHTASNHIIHKADNNFIQTMNNPLMFKGINFVYLYPGNRKIQTIDASNKLLIDSAYAIKDSTLYTSYVFTKAENKISQHIIADTLLSNLGTNAAFRFLNFSYDKINVDMYDGETKILNNRPYDGNKLLSNHYKFATHSSGSKKIIIKNDANAILAEKDVNIVPGMHYSFVLIKHTTEDKYELVAHQQYRN